METVGQQSKVFGISRGIAKYNIKDHYAVLGLPLIVDPALIRRKFMKLAKTLHPDICGQTPAEKELATNYFAKMVSPAYQVLSNEKERNEYFATVRLLGQDLKKRSEEITLESEAAKKLYRYAHETTYLKAVSELAERQYSSLDLILENTATLSEFNLVFLMTQDSIAPPVSVPTRPEPRAGVDGTQAPQKKSKAARNIKLAELYVAKQQWAEALAELKAGEKLDPANPKLYALLGAVYFNQKMMSMAKASLQKALKLNPKEPIALDYKEQIRIADQRASRENAKQNKKGGWFGLGRK
jgi:curved DNA-binding protein CbpA